MEYQDIGLYSALSHIALLKSYRSKITFVAFAGFAIPLFVFATSGLVVFVEQREVLVWSVAVLVATMLVSAVVVWRCLGAVLAPLNNVLHALQSYTEQQQTPQLPTKFADEIGQVMAQIQHLILRFDCRVAMLEQSVAIDYLTDVYNRRAGMNRLREDIARAQRESLPFTIAFFDIDDFKSINDTYGHLAGDDALQHVTQVVRHHLRQGDWLMRWGGDEFVIGLWNADIQTAWQAMDRIRSVVADEVLHGGGTQGVQVTISVGLCHDQGYTAQALIDCADKALRTAKQSGRNKIVC